MVEVEEVEEEDEEEEEEEEEEEDDFFLFFFSMNSSKVFLHPTKTSFLCISSIFLASFDLDLW